LQHFNGIIITGIENNFFLAKKEKNIRRKK